jgi:riboflavin kinase/FMN adenylyltransferase
MGFPTANLAPDGETLPRPGVYVCSVRFLDDGDPARGVVMPAVTNLGYRPTFEDQRDLVAEAHLLDFSGDVYGRRIDLAFLSLLRGEQKFESPDALRKQIAGDVGALRHWLKENPGVLSAAREPLP